MNDRIEKVREYVDGILLAMTDSAERRCAYLHLYGVAQAAAMIAMKRGENVELAIAAGMLHDIYTYSMMDSREHGPKGAIMAREILEKLALFTKEEIDTICHAIDCHSDKEGTHMPLDEVLIDADVWQHYLYHPGLHHYTHENERIEKLKKEFTIGS